ncbi:hypothetical protein, partial [Neisseria sicca]|uniref:hypothetical protein n=1 Tax=Neisseria sicca TaxID=490 RepID=UPI001C996B73
VEDVGRGERVFEIGVLKFERVVERLFGVMELGGVEIKEGFGVDINGGGVLLKNEVVLVELMDKLKVIGDGRGGGG